MDSEGEKLLSTFIAPNPLENAPYYRVAALAVVYGALGVEDGQIFVNPASPTDAPAGGLIAWADFVKQFPDANETTPYNLELQFPGNPTYTGSYNAGIILNQNARGTPLLDCLK